MAKQLKLDMQLFDGKTFAQSEPDIISALAARKAKRGIAANGLTQKNALAVRSGAWAVSDRPKEDLPSCSVLTQTASMRQDIDWQNAV
jgi:hypothetical protein